MGLARMLPRAEMLIVTTPALAAQKVAVRAADMARKGYLRVAGVIENMSGFTLRSRRALRPVRVGRWGAAWPARSVRPCSPGSRSSRRYRPAATGASRPRSIDGGPASRAFAELVDAVLEVAPVVEMAGCTARLLDAVSAAAERLGTS